MKCKIKLKLSQLGCSWQLELLLGLSWAWQHLGILRDLKGFQGSLMDFNGFDGFKGVLRELNGFQGILSHSKGSKGILVDFNGFSGILRDFWDFKVFPEAFYFIFDFVKLCLYLFDFVLMTQLCTNFVLVFVPLIILARITLQSPTPTKPLSPPYGVAGGTGTPTCQNLYRKPQIYRYWYQNRIKINDDTDNCINFHSYTDIEKDFYTNSDTDNRKIPEK